jgi:hypothetical protein
MRFVGGSGGGGGGGGPSSVCAVRSRGQTHGQKKIRISRLLFFIDFFVTNREPTTEFCFLCHTKLGSLLGLSA